MMWLIPSPIKQARSRPERTVMKFIPRWTRPYCHLSLFVCISVVPVSADPAMAQERPKSEDFSRFESLKSGQQPLDASGRELLDKVAKYYANRIADPTVHKDGKMSEHQQELIRRLLAPPQNPYHRLNAEQRKFVDEFGKAMMTHLEPLAVNATKPIIRVNAARMASEVARGGYDGAADLLLKILDAQNGTDGEKFWALRGLTNLFVIEPDKDGLPGKTIFQKKNDLQITPLERSAIRALLGFVQRKGEFPESAPAGEVDAFRYARCEAIRALGKVRVQSLKNLGQVEGRPALVLLKASRSDGMAPPTSAKERVDAICGFCQLLADKDRDMQLDYAVHHIGQAIAELGEYKNANPNDLSIPWKVAGERMQEALDKWDAGANSLKLANANLVQGLNSIAKTHVLVPLASGQEGVSANVQALRQWLADQIKLEPTASLFKSDPESKLTIK